MANIYTTIQRKVVQGKYDFGEHFLTELDAENFYTDDAVNAVLSPHNKFRYTDDPSHVRYAFEGKTENEDRNLRVIVFLLQGRVKFKTVYEI